MRHPVRKLVAVTRYKYVYLAAVTTYIYILGSS